MARDDKDPNTVKLVELDKTLAAMRKMIEDLPRQFAKTSAKIADSTDTSEENSDDLKTKYDEFFAAQKANTEALKRREAILVRDRKVHEAKVFMQQARDKQSFLKMSIADKAVVLNTMMTTEKQAVKAVLRSLSPIEQTAVHLRMTSQRIIKKVNSLSDEFKEHIGEPIQRQIGGIVETFTGPFYGIFRQTSRYLSSIGAYTKTWEGMKSTFATIKGLGKPKPEKEKPKLTVEDAYGKLGMTERKKLPAPTPVPELNLFENLSPDMIAAAFGKVKGFQALEKLAEIDFGKLAGAPKVAIPAPAGTAKETGLSLAVVGIQDSVSAMSSGLYDVKEVLSRIYNSNIVGSIDTLTYSLDQLAAKQQPSKTDMGDIISGSITKLDATLRGQSGLILGNLYDMWSTLVDMNDATQNCGCIDNAVIKGITSSSQSMVELGGTYASMQDNISAISTNIGHINENVGKFDGIYAEYLEYRVDFRDKLFKHLKDIEHAVLVGGGGGAGSLLTEAGGEILGDLLGGKKGRGRRGRGKGLLGKVFGKMGGKALGGAALLGAGISAYEGYSEGKKSGLGGGAASANAVARGTITGATTAIGGLVGGAGGAFIGGMAGDYIGGIANKIGENLGTEIFDIKESAVKSFSSLGSKLGIGVYDVLNTKFDSFLGKGKTIKDYLFDIFRTFLPGMGLMSMAKSVMSLPPKAPTAKPATVSPPKATTTPKVPVMRQPEPPRPSPLKEAATPQTVNVKTTSTVGWDPAANTHLTQMNKNLEELVAISRMQKGGQPAGGGGAGLNIPNTSGDPRAINNGNYFGQRDKQWSR